MSLRQTAGRPLCPVIRGMEESPGSTGIRCRLTAGGGDPRDSATENKPPVQGRPASAVPRARVKRCGKSAPRPWQRGRQGKPHREQDRIGAAASSPTDRGSQGHSRPAVRVGRVRRAVRRVPEEWSSRARNGCGQNPAYRPSGISLSVRSGLQKPGMRAGVLWRMQSVRPMPRPGRHGQAPADT